MWEAEDRTTEFQTTEKEEGALDSIERADFKIDGHVLRALRHRKHWPQPESTAKGVKGHEVIYRPNLYFQTFYLGPVKTTKFHHQRP